MFGIQKRRKDPNPEKTKDLNEPLQYKYLTKSLNQNIAEMRRLFKDDDIMKIRYIESKANNQLKFYICFSDGVIDSLLINKDIIRPLLAANVAPGKGLIDTLMNQVLLINDIKKTNQLKEIVESVTYGDTILFAEGESDALILNTKKFEIRSVEEPNNEKTLSGPREGYTESILANLSMLRRKIRSNDLKMKLYQIGKRTKTTACICYLDSLAKRQIIDELYRRLDKVDIDGVMDTNYIIEMITDAPKTPFPSIGITERPDVTVSKLLCGRVALFLDGTPVVLTLPYLFVENLQSSEDYYVNYFYSSFSRILRIIGLFMTTMIPGLFIAIVAYHHEMMPTTLIISIASARKSVPLPAIVECIIMLGVFELIKETGARMPSNIGQALSIVGALVIGDAAVSAHLVAAPMVIVVATTGISSMLIPKMSAPIIYIRVLLLMMSSVFGLYGFSLGFSFVMIHILNLRSFGVPQISFAGKFRFQNIKDTFFRAPWSKMNLRPNMISEDPVRLKNGGAQSEN